MPTTNQPLLDVKKTNFLSVLDFEPVVLERCIGLAADLKRARGLKRGAGAARPLADLPVALLFEKASLRTRTTFEIAIHELGGFTVTLPPDVALGTRESVADVARNLERWVGMVIIRTFAHPTVVEFALAAPRLHVVNALTDEEHPCQALADLLTLQEHWGDWRGRTLAFIGDGNNVATSLAHASAMVGMHFRVASPTGYEMPQRVLDDCRTVARHGATVTMFDDPVAAVRGADAVYTDVWTSMGQEAEADQRREVFAPYQVNISLMEHANERALFLHCLPAKRGEEVTADVLESTASVVFDQAENRLHSQKALLLTLVGSSGRP